ncbi:restriction endonuclease subunit S [Saccharopolyspora erythraea]|uniref:restriction endonuclease subunit S n=1 Tax=Saccharopolyspora erythraea TaxID=1836 RepID=UPI001BA45F97|nr:restriction endonuclease subunit S [Saccharopolyspora erythraea]QUH01115.1 restriction endonuclease subunit S [Saccharopolyspora erythraea]
MTATKTSVIHFSALDRWDPPQTSEAAASYAWPVVKLGDVADIRLGMQVPRKGSKSGEPRQYLRAINVRRSAVDLNDIKTMYVTEKQASGLVLQPGDLLFVEGSGSVTEVGRAARWDGSVPNVIHQNSVVRARLHDARLDPEYVVTWFNSREGNFYIREQATTTSGLYHIGAAKLANTPIPVPPLDLQRKIVSSYKETFRTAEKAQYRSETLTAAAWHRFGDQLVARAETGEASTIVGIAHFSALDRWDTDVAPIGISSPYPLVKLDSIAEVQLGVQLKRSHTGGQDVPYLRVANVQRGYVDTSDVKTMNVSPGTIDRLALQRDDLLFLEANSLEEVGRCARWDGQISKCIHQNHVIRARLDSNELLPEYVEAWFNSPAGGSHVRAHARTTSGTLYTIPVNVLATAPVPVPPREEQIRLVEKLREDLSEARAVQHEAERLPERAERDLVSALTSSL